MAAWAHFYCGIFFILPQHKLFKQQEICIEIIGGNVFCFFADRLLLIYYSSAHSLIFVVCCRIWYISTLVNQLLGDQPTTAVMRHDYSLCCSWPLVMRANQALYESRARQVGDEVANHRAAPLSSRQFTRTT